MTFYVSDSIIHCTKKRIKIIHQVFPGRPPVVLVRRLQHLPLGQPYHNS